MFRPIANTGARRAVTLQVDGRPITAREGDTLAIALLNADVIPFRQTPVSAQPRAPLCLMGACFDCLVEVDGRQNVQSCMVEVSEGMQVRLPTGARRAEDAA
ncbi:MAG: (2Fe-2S)-binding protein [Burkholderiaceae bacterium]|nr:(2Fe-2S)-binding protein [Burkholderiaceae bacterium]